MRKLAFRLALVVAGWLVVEAAAFALLWVRDGAPSPPGRWAAERAALLAAAAAGDDAAAGESELAAAEEVELARLARGGAEEEVLQPYLGYVVDPAVNRAQHRHEAGRLVVTELGFFARPGAEGADTETAKAGEAASGGGAADERDVSGGVGTPESGGARPLRVGVFGGSVAFIFSFVSREALAAELAAVPAFAGRPIEIRSFALGSYKQPQQLQALTYLLSLGEPLDLVLELDGFNEVVLPAVQNVPQGVFPAYPASWAAKVGRLPDPVLDRLRGEVAYLRELRTRRARAFTRPVLGYSYLWNLLWQLQDARLAADLAAADLAAQRHRPPARRYLAQGPERAYPSDVDLYPELAALWHRSSLQMSRLCAANGILYFHFLQPNQYVPGSKPLSREERRTAFDPTHPYRAAVVAGYPYLIAAGETLRADGVPFHDLTTLFADHPETLYFDTCCHVNQRGGDLLATAVAQAIQQDLASTPASR